MKEIYPRFYIGSETDYELSVKYQSDWWVVHACKEPYHRQLLGYKSRGAPQNHPEYLVAQRGNRLYLNLIDAADPDYIPKQIIDSALEFINEALKAGHKVLVHCNLGESRSPTIGLLYLAIFTDILPRTNLFSAETRFRKIYPYYNPGAGIQGFLERHWNLYLKLAK